MIGVNKVILIGTLGKDPELRYTTDGKSVASFSIATNERWNDKNGQRQERTEWHNIVVWGKMAETCNQYLSKSKSAYIEGRITTRSWNDNGGITRYKTEIVATKVQFLGGGEQKRDEYDQTLPSEEDYNQEQPINQQEPAIDDLPF